MELSSGGLALVGGVLGPGVDAIHNQAAELSSLSVGCIGLRNLEGLAA